MNWWQSLLLGLVEGLSEYLPISSTGHLLLTQHLLGIPADSASGAFAICIQAGAILAVLTLYFPRMRQMLEGVRGKDPTGLRLATNVIAGFFPALVIGLVLEKPIKKFLFDGEAFGLWPVIGAWFVGGLAILATAWFRRRRQLSAQPRVQLDQMTWLMALLIGSAQCAAMWPGTSRSLVTIVAGILVGLRMADAVEFSFLLGVLTLSAATAHDALKYGSDMLASYGILPLAIGFLAAWISATLAVKWMVGYLNRHGLSIFGYYRIALALVAGAFLYIGR